MKIYKTEDPLRWIYEINDNIHRDITMNEELEHWLKKPLYQPKIDKENRIISLKNIPIEEILEQIICGRNKGVKQEDCINIVLHSDDLTEFKLILNTNK